MKMSKTVQAPPSEWHPNEEDYEDWLDAEFGLPASEDEPIPEGSAMLVGPPSPYDMILDRGCKSRGLMVEGARTVLLMDSNNLFLSSFRNVLLGNSRPPRYFFLVQAVPTDDEFEERRL
jgi:hypothetical protein